MGECKRFESRVGVKCGWTFGKTGATLILLPAEAWQGSAKPTRSRISPSRSSPPSTPSPSLLAHKLQHSTAPTEPLHEPESAVASPSSLLLDPRGRPSNPCTRTRTFAQARTHLSAREGAGRAQNAGTERRSLTRTRVGDSIRPTGLDRRARRGRMRGGGRRLSNLDCPASGVLRARQPQQSHSWPGTLVLVTCQFIIWNPSDHALPRRSPALVP